MSLFSKTSIFKATIAIAFLVLGLTLLFNILSILVGRKGSNGLPLAPPILIDFLENIPFMVFALIFGAVGAYLKTILNKESATDRSETIIFGGWLGVVGYFCLESKVLLRIFYSKVNYDDAEIHFVPLAFVAMLFGFFALEIVDHARKQITKRFSQTEQKGSEDAH